MSKYGDRTHNWFEAIVNKMGGEAAADSFLRGELELVRAKPKWTERDGVIYFTLVSNGLTGLEWIVHLEGKGYQLTKWAKDLLNSGDFMPTPKGTVHEMGAIRATQFKDDEGITWKIRAKAKKLKMFKAHPETACLIRVLFTDKELEEMGLWYIMSMHEPILDSDRDPGLLSSSRHDGGLYLDAYCGEPGYQWNDNGAFAFGLRK